MNSNTRAFNFGIPQYRCIGLSALAAVTLALPAPAAVVIDWVPVGNAGNAADSTTGHGAVGYDYQIGKYEVTIGQYTEFLNNAAKSDPYALYNPSMASDGNIAGISRSGSNGSYEYEVMGGGDRPIAYVSWFDAARFCNWLHNGQGAGSTETGVYNLNGATSGIFLAQPDATVWIPTENEWYKAAYYDPTPGAGGGDNYWLYPTRSDELAGNTIGDPYSANYHDGDYATTQSVSYSSGQNYLTNVGAYGSNSSSYYGTFDQGGNLWEWNDAVVSGSYRGRRGGSWNYSEEYLRPWNRYDVNRYDPSEESSQIGFRVASVPEPGAMVLVMLSGVVAFARRRR